MVTAQSHPWIFMTHGDFLAPNYKGRGGYRTKKQAKRAARDYAKRTNACTYVAKIVIAFEEPIT